MRVWLRVSTIAGLSLGLWACTGTGTTRCGSERCSADQECATVSSGQRCVLPWQFGPCQGQANGSACTNDDGSPGYRCDTEICIYFPGCGNGAFDPGEECDLGFQNADTPNASCRTDCTAKRCGDSVADDGDGETCDGTDFGGLTCELEGSTGGQLACTSSCTIDYSGCDLYWARGEELNRSAVADGDSPRLGIDGQGNVVLVWRQEKLTPAQIWSRRYQPGSGWETETEISDGNAATSAPSLAVDAAGNAIAVWVQHDGTADSIWFNRYVAGSGWGTPATIESAAGVAHSPHLAIDGSGNAIAVWVQDDGTADSVYASRYEVGTGWTTPELLEASAEAAETPRISGDAAGNAVAIWTQSDGTGRRIYVNHYDVGLGWDNLAIEVTTALGNATNPDIALSASGSAVAVWQHVGLTLQSAVRASVYGNAVWGADPIVDDESLDALNPRVKMNSAGDAIVVWHTDENTLFYGQAWANRYIAGAGWGTAQALEPLNTTSQSTNVTVAFGDDGHAMCLWQDAGIRFARFSESTGWTAGQDIAFTSSGIEPDVVMTGNGHAFAAWTDAGGLQTIITSSHTLGSP